MDRSAALLVIHGIGEQRPYETLDAFVRGLAPSLGARGLAHRLVLRDDRARSAIRMALPGPLGATGATRLDLYEHYWANQVDRRIGLRQVLTWVAWTSLTPIRFWASQPTEPLRAGGTRRRAGPILIEALRLFLPVLVVALLLAPLTLIDRSRAVPDLSRAGAQLQTMMHTIQHPLAFAVWLVQIGVISMLVWKSWRLWLTHQRAQSSMALAAFESWRIASLTGVLFLLLTSWWTSIVFRLPILPLLLEILGLGLHPPAVQILFLAALLLAARYGLVRYLGDVVAYVSADERRASHRTREQILSSATSMLRSLLSDPAYEAVYLAGHSLGSVIAYDVLNRLVREQRAVPDGSPGLDPKAFAKLRGLLTFGSPLDKVHYFFRTRVREDQAIRAQILASLHAFRIIPSGREYGPFMLERYVVPEPPGFVWLNVHSVFDRVSNRLTFYRVDAQRHRPYWNPLTAHLAYWSDPGFYAEVAAWLRGNVRAGVE